MKAPEAGPLICPEGNKTEGNRTRWKESSPKYVSVSPTPKDINKTFRVCVLGGGWGGGQGGGSHCQIRLINVKLN